MIIRPSALGDVCRTVPVLASLRAHFRDARIDWLVRDRFAPAISSHPGLRRPVPFPREQVDLRRLWRAGARRRLREFLASLREERYDMVFDCQGLLRSGIFAWISGASERHGFADAREFGWIGLTHRHRVPRGLHTVERMLALIESAGVPVRCDMRLYTSEADRAALHPELASVSVGAGGAPGGRAGGYAVLAPTSMWEGKRWPADRFADLARTLLGEGAVERIALVGGPKERDQCEPLLRLAAREKRIIDLIGATDVGGLMAVIERAALVVANDSAAVHIAVGFDRPLIGLYGPTRIDLVGPYRRACDTIQAEAPAERNRHKEAAHGQRAMMKIDTQRVVEAALLRLGHRMTGQPS